MARGNSWLIPLTGLGFLVVAIISFAVAGGEPPDPTEDSAREIVDFYVDKKDGQFAGAILQGIAASLFVFFAGYLRRVLRDAEGEGGILSAVCFAGAIIFAAGIALDGTITITLAETADDIDPSAVQALSALWNNDFLPFAVGIQVFIFSLGLSVLLHRALPKWVGAIAVLLGVLAVTPAGFVAFIGSSVLVAVISVLLAMRARQAPLAGGA